MDEEYRYPEVCKETKTPKYSITKTDAILEGIAVVAYEVNRAYCKAIGDNSNPPWQGAPEGTQQRYINGVLFYYDNHDTSPEQQHNEWLKEKEAEGWKYGPEKNIEKKEHPGCVPHADLPQEQKIKDHLFWGVVDALLGFFS